MRGYPEVMSDQQPDETPSHETSSGQTPSGEVAVPDQGAAPAQPPATWPSAPAGDLPAAAAPQGSYAPPQAAYAPPVAVPTSGNAIIAFVLSIVSWAICPIVPAIVALVLAASAQREVTAGQGRVQGGGLITAAKIIAWINIGLWAAILVIGGFVALLAVVASS